MKGKGGCWGRVEEKPQHPERSEEEEEDVDTDHKAVHRGEEGARCDKSKYSYLVEGR